MYATFSRNTNTFWPAGPPGVKKRPYCKKQLQISSDLLRTSTRLQLERFSLQWMNVHCHTCYRVVDSFSCTNQIPKTMEWEVWKTVYDDDTPFSEFCSGVVSSWVGNCRSESTRKARATVVSVAIMWLQEFYAHDHMAECCATSKLLCRRRHVSLFSFARWDELKIRCAFMARTHRQSRFEISRARNSMLTCSHCILIFLVQTDSIDLFFGQ